jgi:hypothetical protein
MSVAPVHSVCSIDVAHRLYDIAERRYLFIASYEMDKDRALVEDKDRKAPFVINEVLAGRRYLPVRLRDLED